MADDDRTLGQILHEARQAGGEQRPRPMPVEDWAERDPRLQALDEQMAESVAAEVRKQIAAALQAQADREQEALDAFPGDPGFIGAARAARVAVLIAKGEISGEGLMP